MKSLNARSSNENFANIKNQGIFIPNQESVSQVKGKSRLYLDKISTKENQKQNEMKQRSAYVNQTNMKLK